MKKKVIKLIIILILIGIVVYFNAFKPAKIYEKTANINIIDYKIEGEDSDEEILDYIRKQDVTVYYETKFNGVKSEKISLKDASIRQN